MGHVDNRLQMLSGAGFFAGLDTEALAVVLEAADEQRVDAGTVFFRQDDPATKLYLLTMGRVKLTQLTPEGQQVLLRIVERGEMFGGIAVLTQAACPVTAEAAEDCLFLMWTGSTMHRLIEKLPQIALNALQHMSSRVQDLQHRVRELATERVEQRIARALVRLAAQAGERTSEGVRIAMSLTRRDLGELTGSTLYTVSRTLSRWESNGLIKSGRERVVICKPHELTAIAEDLPRDSQTR